MADKSGTRTRTPTVRTSSSFFAIGSRPVTGRVLIVEPDPDISRLLEVRLAREGHDVLTADTARRAIELGRHERIDAALVDRGVPDMPWQELLSALDTTQASMKVVLMSVDPTTDLLVAALEAGAFSLMVKPFANLKVVTLEVRNAVAGARAVRDRDELARMLAAQTQDLAHREEEAERAAHAGGNLSEDRDGASAIDLSGGVDAITGLPNRKAAEERFKSETTRALRYDRPLCIALASVDHLDSVIDRFGGSVADGVLRGVASIFTGLMRDVDFCARRHGGEFFFIFPETTKESGSVVVDRIRCAIGDTEFSELDGGGGVTGGFRLSISFGVAGLPADTLNAKLLREAAEIALAHAKSAGDRVVPFDRTMLDR